MNVEWVNEASLRKLCTDENGVFFAEGLDDLGMAAIGELNAFHAQAVKMVELKDDYLCGIRADHFVVEIGWSEYDEFDADGEPAHVYCLLSGNHKGIRVMTLFKIARELLVQA